MLQEPHDGTTDRPPLPQSAPRAVNLESAAAEIKSETRDLRRAVEKRERGLKSLDAKLRALVTATAEAERASKHLEQQSEAAERREAQLQRLFAAAKKRRAQLQCDVSDAEKRRKSAEMNFSKSNHHHRDNGEEENGTNANNLANSRANVKPMEMKSAVESKSRIDAELQKKILETRAKYRKISEENRKLHWALEGICSDPQRAFTYDGSYSKDTVAEHHEAFENALVELMNTFESVTQAAIH